jgi:hypothetical protein
MEMKRVVGAVAVSFGVIFLLIGLLFLVGSAGQARRLAVAAIALAGGAVLTGQGIRSFKRAEAESPEQLRAEILSLARERNGEVAESEVAARLGDRFAAARAVIDGMATAGELDRRSTAGVSFLIFPALQPRLMTRKCEYCGAELPISKEVTTCPSCGGTVTERVVRRSMAAGESFAMDDEERGPTTS